MPVQDPDRVTPWSYMGCLEDVQLGAHNFAIQLGPYMLKYHTETQLATVEALDEANALAMIYPDTSFYIENKNSSLLPVR